MSPAKRSSMLKSDACTSRLYDTTVEALWHWRWLWWWWYSWKSCKLPQQYFHRKKRLSRQVITYQRVSRQCQIVSRPGSVQAVLAADRPPVRRDEMKTECDKMTTHQHQSSSRKTITQTSTNVTIKGWRPPGAQSAFIKWTGWTLPMTMSWWQHHKHC